MLDDTGIGNLPLGIVDLGKSLIVGNVQRLCLKPNGAVVQLAIFEVIKLINPSREHDVICYRFPFFLIVKEVGINLKLNNPLMSLLYPPMGTPW